MSVALMKESRSAIPIIAIMVIMAKFLVIFIFISNPLGLLIGLMLIIFCLFCFFFICVKKESD